VRRGGKHKTRAGKRGQKELGRRRQSVRRAHRRDEHRLGAIGIWEEALQSRDLRQVVDDDVGVGRVPRQEILVIGLSREEGSVGLNPGDNRGVERMRLVELGDVGSGTCPISRYEGKHYFVTGIAGITSM
jgi:hypothetical protein